MASTSLLLVHPKKDQSSIICQLTDGKGVRIRIPCGLSVKTKHWSKSNNKVLSADSTATEKNKALTSLKKRVLEFTWEVKRVGSLSILHTLKSK